MKYSLVITPQAKVDIQDAIYYYNSKQKGLGERFFSDLNHQLNTIAENPFYHSIRYDTIRYAHLYKFPYSAHYTVIDDKIIVYAVLSDYQNKL